MDKNLIIISVGGSLIVPDKIDVSFLKSFKDLIIKYIKRGKRFIIICGGGKTARNYQETAKSLGNSGKEDNDWLGIYGTKIRLQKENYFSVGLETGLQHRFWSGHFSKTI